MVWLGSVLKALICLIQGWVLWLIPLIPALWGQGRWITWAQEFKTSLANMVKPVSTKNMKISRAWWWVPVIPATQEAEARESLEPGRLRLQWAKIAPLNSSRGDRVRIYLKKEKRRNLPWYLGIIEVYSAYTVFSRFSTWICVVSFSAMAVVNKAEYIRENIYSHQLSPEYIRENQIEPRPCLSWRRNHFYLWSFEIEWVWLGMVTQAYNPSPLGG